MSLDVPTHGPRSPDNDKVRYIILTAGREALSVALCNRSIASLCAEVKSAQRKTAQSLRSGRSARHQSRADLRGRAGWDAIRYQAGGQDKWAASMTAAAWEGGGGDRIASEVLKGVTMRRKMGLTMACLAGGLMVAALMSGLRFTTEDVIEVHHHDEKHNNNAFDNLAPLHGHCHDEIHGRKCQ